LPPFFSPLATLRLGVKLFIPLKFNLHRLQISRLANRPFVKDHRANFRHCLPELQITTGEEKDGKTDDAQNQN
jgi:hypothetical protein